MLIPLDDAPPELEGGGTATALVSALERFGLGGSVGNRLLIPKEVATDDDGF
jgi:hypothetical protein